MCENLNNIYQYTEDELPPFPGYTGNITYEPKSQYKYKLKKQIRNHRIVIGQYSNYELAHHIKTYLDDKKWKSNEIKHLQNVTKEIHERNRYIHKRYGKYHIIRNKKNKQIEYGIYENLELARYIRDELKNNNWNIESIEELEDKYDYNKNHTKYFYDTTDYFAIT